MMGSPRRADGWPLAVPVGPLGGARPWEDTLGVEWGLAREPGKAALRKGVLPHLGGCWRRLHASLRGGCGDGGVGHLSPPCSEINSLVPLRGGSPEETLVWIQGLMVCISPFQKGLGALGEVKPETPLLPQEPLAQGGGRSLPGSAHLTPAL